MTAGSPGASLWDTSVAAAQAGGVSVSLYAPPAETPQASKLYTGWGLEQEPAQAQPLADSFLQIDRCAASSHAWILPYLAQNASSTAFCSPLYNMGSCHVQYRHTSEYSGASRTSVLEIALKCNIDLLRDHMASPILVCRQL